ncbi:hypothetical protein [Methylococcus sp. EFPC2]|uniref:hypothetical protein n=1 Tax=Methylococcus sp. EFPC2 TaxID=2812648 RepID=UPI0019678EF5|nr:hypothetical protein [Methylococcus sp. EFPC2]QSA98827.1 hypothetical protein JWZ97_08635 [Methylococcus sp. EFPC2]
MTMKTLSLLGASVIGLGLSGAAGAAQDPNYYECSGRNASLTLTIGSDTQPGILPAATTLQLQLGTRNYRFDREELTSEPTLVGDLWEVTLEHIPDLYLKHASVIIPDIALGRQPVAFNSQLILTTVHTPFSPQVFEGVVNPSKYIDLRCTASLVYF